MTTRTTIFNRFLLLALLSGTPAASETLRIATWNVGLDRRGPGLLVQDLAKAEDPQIAAIIRVMTKLDADVILPVATDIAVLMDHSDADAVQVDSIADAGELEQLWRVD